MAIVSSNLTCGIIVWLLLAFHSSTSGSFLTWVPLRHYHGGRRRGGGGLAGDTTKGGAQVGTRAVSQINGGHHRWPKADIGERISCRLHLSRLPPCRPPLLGNSSQLGFGAKFKAISGPQNVLSTRRKTNYPDKKGWLGAGSKVGGVQGKGCIRMAKKLPPSQSKILPGPTKERKQ